MLPAAKYEGEIPLLTLPLVLSDKGHQKYHGAQRDRQGNSTEKIVLVLSFYYSLIQNEYVTDGCIKVNMQMLVCLFMTHLSYALAISCSGVMESLN